MYGKPCYWELFVTWLIFRLLGKRIYREYVNRLPLHGDEAVLDFGCGMGTVAYYAAKRLPRGHLTCADISARWLSACRRTLRRCGNVSFRQGDIDALALPKESFDFIYCHFVLHDIPDSALDRVLPVLAESLKPKGLLAFRDPLGEATKRNSIQRLMEQNGLSRKDSRITDVPLLGNTLESIYSKQ